MSKLHPDDEPQTEASASESKSTPAVNVADANWKSALAFWKVPPMPPKDHKVKSGLVNYRPISEKKEKEKKIPKPIPRISKRRAEEIKQNWGEMDVFKQVLLERGANCEECGKHIPNPKPHHFDHVKAKGMNKALRLDPENIKILCFAHHFEKTTGLKYKGIDLD